MANSERCRAIMKKLVITLLLTILASDSAAWARNTNSKIYTSGEIDRTFQELRIQADQKLQNLRSYVDQRIQELHSLIDAQSISKTELDSGLNSIQSYIDHLLDEHGKLEEQQTEQLKRITESMETLAKQKESSEKNSQCCAPGSSCCASSSSAWTYVSTFGPALIEGVLTALAVWLTAHWYTFRIKKIESTLEFSRRFWELNERRNEMNSEYAKKHPAGVGPSDDERKLGLTWWWRFFDLIMYEYDFFKRALVWNDRFKMWMKWRYYNHNFEREEHEPWEANGVDYATGWSHWQKMKANEHAPFQDFLDRIHAAKNSKEVGQIVEKESVGRWHKLGMLFNISD
jgi:hypothetical protein